ncbi:MAG: acyltransferase family protein [Treponemataceae bacterium]
MYELKKDKIDSFTGLKAVAMLAVFVHHSALRPSCIDFGARACEFLFIISGFLVAYNYHDKNIECSWIQSFNMFFKKFIIFWPLHFIMTTVYLILAVFKNEFTLNILIAYILKLLFLQSWSNNISFVFSLNGGSWFIATLLFCYFLTPLFLKFIKYGYRSIILFIIVFLSRLGLECQIFTSKDSFYDINTHVFPIVRALEFLLGMLAFPFYNYLKKYKIKSYLFVSFLEIFILLTYAIILVAFNSVFSKPIFCLFSCAFILSFSLLNGIVSKFFSLKIFKYFSKIQFEFYLVHGFFLEFTYWIFRTICNSNQISISFYIQTLIAFCIAIFISFIYKKYFSSLLIKPLDYTYTKVTKLIAK